MSDVVTRFAPSPTGALHLGHAYAAWVASSRAREAGGRFLLRLEDIDRERCRPAYAEAILDDLTWLGLRWDGEVVVQSGRLALYASALDGLRARGLLYPCFCSRADILREIAQSASAPHGPDGAPLYPGTCRSLGEAASRARMASGAPHAWRLDMARAMAGVPSLSYTDLTETPVEIACAPGRFGDVVLARQDTGCGYHLCVTHDDASQGVTVVTRGEDLRHATDLHRLLQHLMGWPAPAYVHHRLVTDATGRRLAKRDRDVTIAALRAAGFAPADVLARAGCSPP